MNKIFVFISYLSIIAALVLMILFAYWSFYPYNPVDFKNDIYPVLNDNKTVEQGGILKYQIDYCKNVEQLPIVNKKYVDSLVYDTPEGRGLVIKGCHVQTIDNLVPMNLLPGEYYMQITIDYEMNPLRHIIYNNRTERFTVINKGE